MTSVNTQVPKFFFSPYCYTLVSTVLKRKIMSKSKVTKHQDTQQSRFPDTENPFLTDMAEELWETIRQKGTPISKEEILRQLAEQKERTNE